MLGFGFVHRDLSNGPPRSAPHQHLWGQLGQEAKILFISTDAEGRKGGMVSEIADHVPFPTVSIRHCRITDGEQGDKSQALEVGSLGGRAGELLFEENNRCDGW